MIRTLTSRFVSRRQRTRGAGWKAWAIKAFQYFAKTPQTLGFSLGFALLVFLLLGYTWREAFRDVLIVDPIAVPRHLDEAGLTPQVIANRVRDELGNIEMTTKTSLQRDRVGSGLEPLANREVEISGTKFGLDTLVEMVRALFGVHPKHIGGDVVIAASAIHETGSDIDNLPLYLSMYFLQANGSTQSLSAQVQRRDVPWLTHTLAELALRQANANMLAAYEYDEGRCGSARKIAEPVGRDPSQAKPYRAYAYVLLGYISDTEGKLENSISEHKKAIDLDRQYGLAYKAAADEEEKAPNGNDEEAIGYFAMAAKFAKKDLDVVYDHWGKALERNAEQYAGHDHVLKARLIYVEAAEKYWISVKLNPDNWDAHLNLAKRLRALGLSRRAAKEELEAKRSQAVPAQPSAEVHCRVGE